MTSRRQHSPSKVAIRRAWAAIEERGLPVKAARVCVNGDVILLTEVAALPVSSEDELDRVIAGLIDDEN